MLQLYFWPTPNGRKIPICLEELEVPYELIPVNIHQQEQFSPHFSSISPSNKIPVLVDTDGVSGGRMEIFESGAILLYLAEKYGRLISSEPGLRYEAVKWLMFQMSAVGPMFGQRNHFRLAAAERIPYAIDRYTNESRRLMTVLDKRFATVKFLAGEYSVADIATYPWINVAARQDPEQLEVRPNLKGWYEAMHQRPAVVRAMALMADKANRSVKTETPKKD